MCPPLPAEPAVSIRYEFSNVRVYTTASAIGTQLSADLTYTKDGCTATYRVAANSFLALKISYINAVSVICESSGANIQEVANGIEMEDFRIDNVPQRLARLGDLWAPLLSERGRVDLGAFA